MPDEEVKRTAEEQEKSTKSEEPKSVRRSAKPDWVYVYRDEDGYRYVGLAQSGRKIKESESEGVFPTAQLAKRAARSAYPELRIIQ